jgi:hypothetical protein
MVGALGLAVVVAVAAVVLFVLGGYTPTTTAYVQNDTAESITIDQCADTEVTVAPNATEQISPFEDATHAACTVFQGGSDLGTPIGCLFVPSSQGRTIAGAVVRVSTMRRTSGRSGCR